MVDGRGLISEEEPIDQHCYPAVDLVNGVGVDVHPIMLRFRNVHFQQARVRVGLGAAASFSESRNVRAGLQFEVDGRTWLSALDGHLDLLADVQTTEILIVVRI